MNSEEWRQIPGFPDYSVSNFGRVRRDTPPRSPGGRCKPGMIMKAESSQWGHQRIRLTRDGQFSRLLVHRLVAMAFDLPKRDDQTLVAHNDGNPLNNHISNLRWATAKENMADKERHGTVQRGERSGMNKRTGLKENDVREIRRLREEGVPYAAITERFGVNKVTACAIYKRRNWKHVA
jgi:hypothetical protein